MAEVAGDDLFGEDGDSDSCGGDVPDDPAAEDTHVPCGAKPEKGGMLQQAAMVESLVPSADAPGEAQEHEDGSSGGGEEKVKADVATAAHSRPRKQLPGKPPDVAIQAVATSVGKGGDDVWDGVERGHGGVIVKIKWDSMYVNGSLPAVDWGMPHLTEFDVTGNILLIGDIDKVAWPPGLTSVTLASCLSLRGRIDEVQWPERLTSINLAECEGIQGDISVARFPTGLKELNLKYCVDLTGDISVARFPAGLERIILARDRFTGDIDKVQWPQGLQVLDMSGSADYPMLITGDISVARFPTGLKELNLKYCDELTGQIDQVKWPETLTSIDLAYCGDLTGRIDKFQWPETLTYLSLGRPGCPGLKGDKEAAKAMLKAAGCESVWL